MNEGLMGLERHEGEYVMVNFWVNQPFIISMHHIIDFKVLYI